MPPGKFCCRRQLGTLAALGLVLVCRAPAAEGNAALPRAWGDWPAWGDQGDGTYKNPVLPADYSDLDCIRVGPDYYAISSTFQYSPGVVILHSVDLVNWTILGHVVADLRQIGPELNWDRMNRPGRGIWAGALRHHDGKFWVYFGTPDEGYFMSTAADPAGPWTPLARVLAEPGWDDCCPFWDDDGQGYLVGTNFRTGYKTYLFKLTPDGRAVVRDSAVLINEGGRREANKLYKIDGVYYHLFSEWKAGTGRYLMMRRAAHIEGPYGEAKQLARVGRAEMEPNQGGLVQTADGKWFFFTHHGTGAWEGRCASLLPVTWIDGWPIPGLVDADGLGNMAWSGQKPVKGTPIVTPQSSDDFGAGALGVQWEWNYQPRAEMWSLAERPGFLRLRAFPPLRADDFKSVGNVLTQRAFRTTANVVTVALELGGMSDGQVAGLCHYSKDSSALRVRCRAGVRTIEFSQNEQVVAGPVLTAPRVWLRSTWGLDGRSTYSYSVDGRSFVAFGPAYQLGWGSYRGDRIGLFTYNDQRASGYVDFDSFVYRYQHGAASPPAE